LPLLATNPGDATAKRIILDSNYQTNQIDGRTTVDLYSAQRQHGVIRIGVNSTERTPRITAADGLTTWTPRNDSEQNPARAGASLAPADAAGNVTLSTKRWKVRSRRQL